MRSVSFHSYTGGVGRTTMSIATSLLVSHRHTTVISGSEDTTVIAGLPDVMLGAPTFAPMTDTCWVANTFVADDYAGLSNDTVLVWDGVAPDHIIEQVDLDLPPMHVLCMATGYPSLRNTVRALERVDRTYDFALVLNLPGSALQLRDTQRACNQIDPDHFIVVPFDPRIARAVDAGLLAARLPPMLAHPLRPLVEFITRPAAS